MKRIGWLVLLVAALGCQPLTTRTTRTPVVDHAAKPTSGLEKTDSPVVKYEVSENSLLQVAVMKQTLCQRTRETPQRMLVREENELGGSDLLWSILGAGLGSVSMGVGVVSVAAPCEFSDDPECDKDRTRAVGGALIGVGAALFIPLIVNGVRAADTEEFEDAKPKVEPIGKPEQCGIEPMAEATVTVTVANTGIRAEGITDENGMAMIDLNDIAWENAQPNASLQISVNGKVASSVRLATVPSYVAFKEHSGHEAEGSPATAADPIAACLEMFQPCLTPIKGCGRKVPMSIMALDSQIGLECSALAIKQGYLGGPAAKRFTEECEEKAQRAVCEARQNLVDQGIDPDGPEVAKKRLQQWQQLQSIDQKEEQRVLKAGRTAVANNLKAPSTAKLVSEKVMMVCPDGNVVTSHTVDAQNSFGAMLRGTYCAAVTPKGDAVLADCGEVGAAILVASQGEITNVDLVCSKFRAFTP